MKKIMLKWLGGVEVSVYEAEKKRADGVESQLISLKAELLALQNEKAKERPVIAVGVGDPSPLDTAKRRSYVAQAAGFHKDILGPKLKQMICQMREEFEKVNRNTFGLIQSEYDLYLKGAINFGWLLHEWGDEMINEQVANQQGGVDEEELEGLKDKLK